MARRPALSDAGVTRPSLAVVTADRGLPASHASRPPARQGKKMIALYVDPDVSRQLRLAAVNTGTTLQAIMEQAIDAWFRSQGLPPIASHSGNGKSAP
jgi:hypothetical protein